MMVYLKVTPLSGIKKKKKTDMKYILVDCLQSSFSSSTLSELTGFKVLRLPLKKKNRKLSVIVHLGIFLSAF